MATTKNDGQHVPHFNGMPSVLTSIKRLLHVEEIGVLVAFLAICIALAITTDTFLSTFNLLSVTRQASFIGIMAVGMVFVLSMGDIDLSTGAIFMLSGTVTAWTVSQGYDMWLAAGVGLLTGAACGFVNGGLSILLRIPTIIVTLGTMTIYRAFGLVISEARPISGLPRDHILVEIGGGRILDIPFSTIVMVVVTIIGHLVLLRTPFGHRVRAIGSNLQAARFSGIQINKNRLMVMILQGVLCALAGILATVFLKSSDPSSGQGFELLVIAAAIIGGTALSGGSGTVIGAMIGALIIAIIRNGLVLLGVTIYWTGAVTGGVIIVAVTIDYFIKRSRQMQ